MKKVFVKLFAFLLILSFSSEVLSAYPIDGYAVTKIRRLLRLQLILEGKIKDTPPVKGQLKSINEIKLNLLGSAGDKLETYPDVDKELQKEIDKLFPNRDESYSITVLDITDPNHYRFAQRQPDRTFMPGSVGKLAILAGLFTELHTLFPDSFEKRQELLRNRIVTAGKWVISNFHTVPFFNPETNNFFKRTVHEQDVFSMYEWIDHMISVSSNAAASVVWKELVLMRAFGKNYPPTKEQEEEYFSKTPKSVLTDMAVSIVNDPLRKLGITNEEWRLGTLFTKEGSKRIPGKGGSDANPKGLMKYLIALERGKIIDEKSSLEIKRLMYSTDRRIRYAQSPALRNAAVFFKSGSFYKCKPEEGFECKKYAGNVENYMNSVAVVEHEDGTRYLVALMSNVLRKNSGTDHMNLATQIDNIIRKK